MVMVNMLEAKTNLSKLVDAVESGREREVIIARDGRPAARLVPIEAVRPLRLGLEDGKYIIPEPDDALDAEIAAMFYESDEPFFDEETLKNRPARRADEAA